MQLFEVYYGNQVHGYVVGKNGVDSITKKGTKVTVQTTHAELGTYWTYFDLRHFPMYTLA